MSGTDFVDSPELAAISVRYVKAYGVNDHDTLLNLYADDNSVHYIGTAEDEFWDGATFRAILPGYTRTKPEFRILEMDIRGLERDGFGYTAFQFDIEFASGKVATVRGSHVFTLDRGTWRLIHAHHSSPRSNAENMGYEAEGLEDLLAAAESHLPDLGQTGIASVMFTDIADSTTLAETLGDSIWNRVVSTHLDAVRNAVNKAGGKLVKTLGDGTMSSFPSASTALFAAQTIQRENADAAREPHLGLRIGVHTGDVLRADDDVLGTVVNKAARVAAGAKPGEIRVSDATRAMVGSVPDFAFDEPLRVPLKGLEGTHLIHRLGWRE